MSEDRTTKKVFNAQPIGTRRKGRWIDGLEKDLLVLRTGEHLQEEGFLRRPRCPPSLPIPPNSRMYLRLKRIFGVSPSRTGTIHLQISMPPPGFEPRPNGSVVSAYRLGGRRTVGLTICCC
ncbi:hypothetical protein TNCV_4355031 [Trichonephila clavipes]|nr:hypothetical protein TNCV_4355031 [Trichonephila clavipes]